MGGIGGEREEEGVVLKTRDEERISLKLSQFMAPAERASIERGVTIVCETDLIRGCHVGIKIFDKKLEHVGQAVIDLACSLHDVAQEGSFKMRRVPINLTNGGGLVTKIVANITVTEFFRDAGGGVEEEEEGSCYSSNGGDPSNVV